MGFRGSDEVDEAVFAIGFAELFDALAEHAGVEPLAVFLGKLSAKRLGIGKGLIAGEGDARELVSRTFFYGHQDIDALALRWPEGKGIETAGVADVRGWRAGERFEVAAVAIGLTDALGILIELGLVVGAGEEILKDDGARNADGLEVLHRIAQGAIAEIVIAVEGDLANLYGGAFLHVEGQSDGRRRDGLYFGTNGGELVAVRCEQLLNDDLSALDLGRVILTLDGKANLGLFEGVEDVGLRDGVDAFVVDLANCGLFTDVDDKLDALVSVIIDTFDADVVKVAGVPQ